jgi:hypothetical protein
MKIASALAFSLALTTIGPITGCHHDNAGSGDGGSSGNGGGSGSSGEVSLTGFEGEIDLVASGKSNPAPVPLSLLVKNDTIRTDLPQDIIAAQDTKGVMGGGKVYAIVNVVQKKLSVVLDGKKQAVTIDLDQAGEQMKSMRPGGSKGATPPGDPPKVVKTGKKETVAGITCEDWDVLNADKSKLSACVADKGSSFFHLPLTGIPTEHAWALELLDGKHFPLRGIVYDKDGTEQGRVEVTKLDKKTLDASLFQIPAGYQVLSLQDMIASLMSGAMPNMPGTPSAPLDIPPGVQPNGSGGGGGGGKQHGKHHGHKPPS